MTNNPSMIRGTSPQARRALLKNGYESLPIKGKYPLWPWQDGPITDELLTSIETNPRYADHQSTGLRTGRLVIVDIDVTNAEHVEILIGVIIDTLGDTPYRRFGSKGLALAYQNPDPIDKIQVIAPEDT